MLCMDFVLILLKERHSHKLMTESISMPSEDLKSQAFMHHIESNLDIVEYYCSIII